MAFILRRGDITVSKAVGPLISNELAQLITSNASTTRWSSVFPVWCARRCHSRRNWPTRSVPSHCSSVTTTERKLQHYMDSTTQSRRWSLRRSGSCIIWCCRGVPWNSVRGTSVRCFSLVSLFFIPLLGVTMVAQNPPRAACHCLYGSWMPTVHSNDIRSKRTVLISLFTTGMNLAP